MSNEELIAVREKAQVAVQEVGEFVLGAWENEQVVSYKAEEEPVTQVDIQAEEMLVERLAGLVPGAGFLREEGESDEREEYNWTIDPIDQTKNFIARIPLFYVQIALLHKGEPVLGIIYNPVSKQLFSASHGDGAYLNDVRVHPALQDSLSRVTVDLDIGGSDPDIAWRLSYMGRLMEASYRIRITAGAFSPYLLTGGFLGASVVLNQKTKIVDQMPRRALLEEAGFVTKYLEIDGRRVIIYAGEKLAKEIAQLFHTTPSKGVC
ncbi:MAG: inositol monophosphatase family protein [Candidatus Spechtbacterales bacterium]